MARKLNHVSEKRRTSPRTKKQIEHKLSPASRQNNRCRKKRVVHDISLRGPCSRMILNISISPKNTSDVSNCYNFDSEDDDCRMKFSFSDDKTEKKKSKKKINVMGSSRKKGQRKTTMEWMKKEHFRMGKKQELDHVTVKNSRNRKVSSCSKTEGPKIKPAKNDCFLDVLKNITSTPVSDPRLKLRSSLKPSNCTTTCLPSAQSAGGPPKHSTLFSGEDKLDSPMLSPVQQIQTPRSDGLNELVNSQSQLFDSINYGSSQMNSAQNEENTCEPFTVLDISKTYCGFRTGFYEKSVRKRKQRNKKTTKHSISHYDELASEMNEEFDALAHFELSVD